MYCINFNTSLQTQFLKHAEFCCILSCRTKKTPRYKNLIFLPGRGNCFCSILEQSGAGKRLDWGFLSKILFNEAGVGELIQSEVCYILLGLGADILRLLLVPAEPVDRSNGKGERLQRVRTSPEASDSKY